MVDETRIPGENRLTYRKVVSSTLYCWQKSNSHTSWWLV